MAKGYPNSEAQRIASSRANMVEGSAEKYGLVLKNAGMVADIIGAVLDGRDSIAGGCRRYGLHYTDFVRLCNDIAKTSMPAYWRYEAPAYEPTKSEYIYSVVFGVAPEEVWSVMPDDGDETVEWVLSKLTEREHEVMDLRGTGKSLLEVGEALGITRERVRQLEHAAIRKMKWHHMATLQVGLAVVEKCEAEKAAALRKAEAEFEARRAAKLSEEERYGAPIETLYLTPRPYNCLSRTNSAYKRGCGGMKVETIGDLLKLSYDDLTSIRNMGNKSLNEIIEKVHALGLKMAWE